MADLLQHLWHLSEGSCFLMPACVENIGGVGNVLYIVKDNVMQ